jgi:hypothetical protein
MEPEIAMREPVLYRWIDVESGEELSILVQGPPEFLAELCADGFKPVEGEARKKSEGTYRCVVVANT